MNSFLVIRYSIVIVDGAVNYFSLDNHSIIHTSVSERREDAFVRTENHMNSTLYDAVSKDNIHVLREMEGKLSVDEQRTATESTVLHLACQYGSVNCVQHILRVHESLLLKINSRGETALHLAARQGHSQVVAALLAAAKSSPLQPVTIQPEPIRTIASTLMQFLSRMSVPFLTRASRQSLMRRTGDVEGDSIRNGSLSVIEVLIRTSSVERETALHEAVRHNHKDVVQLLVDEDPTHSHPQNKYHETPLYMASARCYTHIIKTILRKCESPRFGGSDGRTALHAAVLDDGGRENIQISECVNLLLDNNKDLVKVQDDYGWTVFHYVAYNDLYTVVEDLVGADICVAYLPDYNDKRTALHVAAYKGNVRVMEKLVDYFPDCWEIVDGNSQNILHIAVEQDRKEVIRYVLSRGCKAYRNLLIQRDREGNTPLHLITKLGCYVQELMDERSLDWEVLNDENLTPLDLVHCGKETNTLTDQAMVRRTLINANVKKHWHLLRTLKEADIEKANRAVIQNEKNTKEVGKYKKWISTHMVVAALITTVALTAGFTMPGGFDESQGLTRGSAVLLRKKSFQGFIVTDTIALICSISSLFLYFMTTMYEDVGRVRKLFFISALLNTASIITIIMAFILGTYSVLDHSSRLANSIIFISCLFLFIAFLVFSRMISTVMKFLATD